MREILFRGKTIDKNKWYYGSYLFLHLPECDWTGKAVGKSKDVHYIINEEDYNLAVDQSTISQYTGLKDKNGTKIFEGDIIRINQPEGFACNYGFIRFVDGVFEIKYTTIDLIQSISEITDWEYGFSVVGNIYDNPEHIN